MQLIKSLVLKAASAALLASVASLAIAAPVIDQSNDTIGNVSFNGGSPTLTWQQGVVAGLSGKLTAFAVYFQQSDDLSKGTNIFVNLGKGWQSDANQYAAKVVNLTAGWNVFDVSSANIFVNAGDDFVIGLTGSNADSFTPSFTGTAGDQYGDGDIFLNGNLYAAADYDMNFRTYVDAGGQQLPEPTSVALAGLALVGAGLARRRAKKA